MIERYFLQSFVAKHDRKTVALVIGGTLAFVGSLLGLSLALVGPIYTAILLVALAGALWLMVKLENALWATVVIIALLPFATLPFKIVLTPTFLDLTMATAVFHYLMQWITGERRKLAITPVHPFILLFMVLSIFSFAAGLRYAGLTSNVLRQFAELLLSMSFSFILVDVLRDHRSLKNLVLVLIAAGTLAALGGIILWIMPDQLAERILAQLSFIGYPNAGITQYIEQNPELSERAISTSVNPNSLGGLLVMIAALAAPQAITHHPITGKRWHAVPILLGLTTCLVLTFSRGSMLAFGIALLFIAIMRYRKLLVAPIIIGAILGVLPWTQAYITRFMEGFQLADLATQMRIGEYQDAAKLIMRYPVLGVGFSGAPDIDIYLGVANVYLTIAENMGLLGLSAFLVLISALFFYAWQARLQPSTTPGLRPIWLGLFAGLIGALTGGFLDHYFFNLEFQHAIAIFWIFTGLLLSATRLALEKRGIPPPPTDQSLKPSHEHEEIRKPLRSAACDGVEQSTERAN